MNDLRALVDDATPEGAPGFGGVLARRHQRSRRRRGTVALVGTAVFVTVVSLAVQLQRGGSDESPTPPPIQSSTGSSSPTPTPTQIDRPDPTYTWSDKPSRVVIRLPEQDVTLTTWTGCWTGPTGNLDCIDEAPPPI